ncbi:MAG: phage holin family protein [Acidobacteriota bacterium]
MSGELSGLIASLRRMGSTLVGIAQTRLELLSTEVEEERARVSAILVHGYVTIACLSVGILLATLVFVLAWWDRNPVVAVAIPAFVFCAAGIWSLLRLRAVLRRKPKVFAASIDELAKDRATLS